ncbi:MAG TPA: response regulator [Candidatus Krumholzibacteria bacterium]|jgi:two-component system, response regulator|nr:response regulator [Candidatus Krumholzibacteria bacterium]
MSGGKTTAPGDVDILLVEDNANDMELTLRVLRKIATASRIRVVRDGAEALEFLFPPGATAEAAPEPKMILLDLKLPKVDGLEVLHRIKMDERTRCIPTVVLTSSREERDLLRSYRLGANSYVVKPVRFDEFEEAVSELGLYWLQRNALPT